MKQTNYLHINRLYFTITSTWSQYGLLFNTVYSPHLSILMRSLQSLRELNGVSDATSNSEIRRLSSPQSAFKCECFPKIFWKNSLNTTTRVWGNENKLSRKLETRIPVDICLQVATLAIQCSKLQAACSYTSFTDLLLCTIDFVNECRWQTWISWLLWISTIGPKCWHASYTFSHFLSCFPANGQVETHWRLGGLASIGVDSHRNC